MTYSAQEVKAGSLVTLSLLLLLGLTFIVGNFMGGKTQTWQIRFGYISGLKKDAPVYFAGHEVGKVDRIEIVKGEERPVYVTVRITDEVRLRENSEAYVDTLGLMGEKFVELTPGSNSASFLEKGRQIQGTDPIPMYLLVQQMNLLATRMDEMTENLNPMFEQMNSMMKGHDEELAKMIANFHETSANIRDMTHNLKFHPWRLVRKG
ncbi:MAG TPA: MlaD family protein [bacterium]|nr:MlaD family protein [bacterium]